MKRYNPTIEGARNRNEIASLLVENSGVKYSVKSISETLKLNKSSVMNHCHFLTRQQPQRFKMQLIRIEGVMRKVFHFFAV